MAITNALKALGWPEDQPEYFESFKYDTSIVYSSAQAGGSVSVGLAVTLEGKADQTVGLVADKQKVDGKLIKVEADGYCTVQRHGKCQLPGGTSATLTVGSKFYGDLSTAAEGYIQTVAALVLTGNDAADVVEITDYCKGRGLIVDNDTTTAVWVDLDA
jgi:hypothetical protein